MSTLGRYHVAVVLSVAVCVPSPASLQGPGGWWLDSKAVGRTSSATPTPSTRCRIASRCVRDRFCCGTKVRLNLVDEVVLVRLGPGR